MQIARLGWLSPPVRVDDASSFAAHYNAPSTRAELPRYSQELLRLDTTPSIAHFARQLRVDAAPPFASLKEFDKPSFSRRWSALHYSVSRYRPQKNDKMAGDGVGCRDFERRDRRRRLS